ncbi:MAG: hypothetical protein ACN6N0_02190 [Microvirgula sp.]
MTTLLASLLLLAYPLIVYFGLGLVEPRWLAVPLVAVALLRAWRQRDRVWLVVAAGTLVLAVTGLLANAAWPLKLYPLLINAVLLAVFATSLYSPQSVIERLARRMEADFPPEAVGYTRRVTQVWCGFFLFNGGVSLLTALWGDAAIWALYNGLISYLLMGVLFAGEWLVRRRVRARRAHA